MHRLSAVCAALAAACTSCSSSSPSAAGPAVHDAGVPDEGSTPGDDGSAMTFSGDSGATDATAPTDGGLPGAGDAMEDPLGIAMSWEEKYAKKKAPDPAPTDEPAAADPSAPAPTKDGG